MLFFLKIFVCVFALLLQIKNTFFVNQTDPIEIDGNITFINLKVDDTLTTNKVSMLKENTTYSHKILETLKDLSDKLKKV